MQFYQNPTILYHPNSFRSLLMLSFHLSLSFLCGIFFSICNQYSAWISHNIHAYYMFHFSPSLIWLPKQHLMHIINYVAPPHTIFSNLLSHSPLSILLCNHILYMHNFTQEINSGQCLPTYTISSSYMLEEEGEKANSKKS